MKFALHFCSFKIYGNDATNQSVVSFGVLDFGVVLKIYILLKRKWECSLFIIIRKRRMRGYICNFMGQGSACVALLTTQVGSYGSYCQTNWVPVLCKESRVKWSNRGYSNPTLHVVFFFFISFFFFKYKRQIPIWKKPMWKS